MKKTKCYRHGEIVFETINKLPGEMQQTKATEFLKGSHGNPHTFNNGKLYLKKENNFVFGYFVAKDTMLFHVEHGKGNDKLKKAKLPNGIYRLRRQNEIVNDELRQVED